VEPWPPGAEGRGTWGSRCSLGAKFQLHELTNSRDLIYITVPVLTKTVLCTEKCNSADPKLSVPTTKRGIGSERCCWK
jgi:hypothetical protein